MWKLICFCIIIGSLYSDAAHHKRKRYTSGFAGGYAGTGAGSFAGTDGFGSFAGTGFDYAPDFGVGFIDPYAFHQQLTAQILAQHAAQNNAIASTFTSGDAFVSADASSYPDDMQIQQQIAREQALYDTIRRQAQNNKGYKTNRYAPSFASASGSVGPGGYYQSASISPGNPSIPNINNRFSAGSGPGGFKGVSVSSFSSSSDIDGKKTSHRGASTTINDNGKVTTYKVQS